MKPEQETRSSRSNKWNIPAVPLRTVKTRKAAHAASTAMALRPQPPLVARCLEPVYKKHTVVSPSSLPDFPEVAGLSFEDLCLHFPHLVPIKKRHYVRSFDYSVLPFKKRPVSRLGHANEKERVVIFTDGAAASSSASPSTTMSVGDDRNRTWEHELNALWGTRPVLVGEKTITASDQIRHQSWLLLPVVLSNEILLHTRDSESKKIKSSGLRVLVLDRRGQHYEMVCKFRARQNGMVFTGNWNNFVEANGLQVDDQLAIVTFRSSDALCFAFVLQRPLVIQEMILKEEIRSRKVAEEFIEVS